MKVPKTPDWVSTLSLNQAVQSILGDGDRILTVIPSVHLIQFRNCTVLLPIRVKVQSPDFTVKKLSFVLKAPHGSDFQARLMSQLKLFLREQQLYHNVLPKLEELYREVGKEITFGPRAKYFYFFDFAAQDSTKNSGSYVCHEHSRSEGFQCPQPR